MKIFFLVLSCTAFFSSCSHEVYNLDVNPDHLQAISSDINGRCDGKCEVDHCWQETNNFTVCAVLFSTPAETYEKNILQTSSKSLSEKGLAVGFCGYDKVTSTQTNDGYFKNSASGSFAGVTSTPAVARNNGPVLKTTIAPQSKTISDETIKKACSSTPTIK